jgi:hypothetical protein
MTLHLKEHTGYSSGIGGRVLWFLTNESTIAYIDDKHQKSLGSTLTRLNSSCFD